MSFEAEYGTDHPVHGTMVLSWDIIETARLSDGNRCPIRGVVAFDGRSIGLAPIDGDRLGHPMAADSAVIDARRA
jgi:hypothetical protein